MQYPEVPFESLNPKQFEEFAFDLLSLNEKFQNVSRRDGSYDGGRDFTAESTETDSSGYTSKKIWHCDAKIYTKGIPFSSIEPTLSHAMANLPDYVLLIVYPHLTPPCKDDLNNWLIRRTKTFQVRIWEKPELIKLAHQYPEVLRKHLPEAWSEQLQMDAYLRELQAVLDKFTARIEVIWGTVEKRPFTDALSIVAAKSAQKIAPHVETIEKVTVLSGAQRAVITSALAAETKLQAFLRKAFNLPLEVMLYVYQWKNHPELWLVQQVTHDTIFREDVRRSLERLLIQLDNNEHINWLHDNGVITMYGSWKPYDLKRHMIRLYALAPVLSKTISSE